MSFLENDDRNILSAGSVISLNKHITDSKQGEPENFTIVSLVSKGGSCICYNAVDESGAYGRLKEYYPVCGYSDYYQLERSGDHQLTVKDSINSEHADKSFLSDCEQFSDTYTSLQRVRNEDNTLSNYMPSDIQLYRGYSAFENKPGSIYVWTKNDKNIITFDKYLEEVKRAVEDNRDVEYHLYNIIKALYELSRCIKILHENNIYHLDIKPENFGVCVDKNGLITPGNISVFDINSIYEADSLQTVKFIGTKGFRAPELYSDSEPVVNSGCDVYSIGATLYYALMRGNGDGIYYKDSEHADIEKNVLSSKLLRASDYNSNSKLLDLLTGCLKESLHKNRRKRYSKKGIDGLVEDLSLALSIIGNISPKSKTLGQKIKVNSEVVDVEQELDKSIPTGAAGAIQRLLLNKPLYKYQGRDELLDVLVLGCGTYAQKFIDLAFEVSQIKGCKLRITVVSNSCQKDRERYLAQRPAFKKFFKVDNSALDEDKSYGTLIFKSTASKEHKKRAFKVDDNEVNAAILDDVLSAVENGSSTQPFSYVFIAMGDDDLNCEIAKMCANRNEAALVSFVQYKKHSKSNYEFCEGKENIVPVMVNEVLKNTKEYRELRRMAFNCHILWEGPLCEDLNVKRAKFREEYSFNSSFANVLSIKYKLHSVGIELESYAPHNTAAAAREIKEKLTNIIDFNELAMYEHRRWVCNCICDGWDTLSDFSSLKNSTKDKNNKLHPCVVHSDSVWRFNEPQWKADNHQKWNQKASLKENLDELDEMSLKLHQHFLTLSKQVSRSDIYKQIETIESYMVVYPNIQNEWTAFYSAFIEILNNSNSRHIWLYKFYYKKFTNALSDLPKHAAENIKDALKFIDDRMFPVLESKKYVDYKAKDQVLVKNIPFILTFSTATRLCVPFGVESKGEINNRVLFGNINAAMYLNPSIITYVIDTDDFAHDIEKFKRALKYVVKAFDERKMQTKIDLVFIHNNYLELPEDIVQWSKSLSETRIGNIIMVNYDNDDELSNKIGYVFDSIQRSKKRITAIEKNHTGVSKLLRGFGCYAKIPAYSLSKEKSGPKFITSDGCEHFNYIEFEEHIRVSEMFAAHDTTSGTQPPQVPDFNKFWDLYKTANENDTSNSKEATWKTLCGILNDQADINDSICKITVPKNNANQQNNAVSRKLYVPSVCYHAVRYILKQVSDISSEVFGKKPVIRHVNNQMCEISVIADEKSFAALNRIVQNPYLLSTPEGIKVYEIQSANQHRIGIAFDNLVVSDFDATVFDRLRPQVKQKVLQLLEELSNNNMIFNYVYDQQTQKISFCYASSQTKQILTNEGKVLELYVYYKAIEENYFDDVVCSYEVIEDGVVENEFDIILTKNFKTLIVECKACKALDQKFYHKLSQLNQHYGINSTPVLVADTLEKSFNDEHKGNSVQRLRGEKYNIVTVYKHNDIIDIGKVLREIMENS